jgi:hypothetical protein
VFVHGLEANQGHWTTENSVFWPENILPGKISNARLLAFEYEDATVDSFWNEEDLISDISDDLLSELMAERRGDKVHIYSYKFGDKCHMILTDYRLFH